MALAFCAVGCAVVDGIDAGSEGTALAPLIPVDGANDDAKVCAGCCFLTWFLQNEFAFIGPHIGSRDVLGRRYVCRGWRWGGWRLGR